jgi:hypothetical protein
MFFTVLTGAEFLSYNGFKICSTRYWETFTIIYMIRFYESDNLLVPFLYHYIRDTTFYIGQFPCLY